LPGCEAGGKKKARREDDQQFDSLETEKKAREKVLTEE